MPEQRKNHNFDFTYHEWHRTASIKRYLPEKEAYDLAMFDVDAVEVCRSCGEPLAIFELTRWLGSDAKATKYLRRVAKMANIPGVLVYYEASAEPNPASPEWNDIARFFIKVVSPGFGDLVEQTPGEYANRLLRLRERHHCKGF